MIKRRTKLVIAVAKIKEDPNFFFRYAKRFSITKQEIGPLYSDNDKKLICKLLLEQFNSAFSIPLSNKVVTDPVSFFAVSNACYKKSEVLLTSINLSVPLQMLFIQYLESGIIPDCLKRAANVPIYKSSLCEWGD